MKEYYTRIIANIRVQCKKEKHQNSKGVLQLSKRTISEGSGDPYGICCNQTFCG